MQERRSHCPSFVRFDTKTPKRFSIKPTRLVIATRVAGEAIQGPPPLSYDHWIASALRSKVPIPAFNEVNSNIGRTRPLHEVRPDRPGSQTGRAQLGRLSRARQIEPCAGRVVLDFNDPQVGIKRDFPFKPCVRRGGIDPFFLMRPSKNPLDAGFELSRFGLRRGTV